jgi:thymidine phosphorylase
MIVRLSPDDLQLLAKTPGLPRRLRERALDRECGEAVELECSRGEAVEAGDALTNLLARVGFDASYAVTTEGSRIEELIDKFTVD